MAEANTWAAVRGERVVTPKGIRPATVVLSEGRIKAVEGQEFDVDGPVLEARDSLVFPGLVDTHVHINDPGRTDWEGFATATAAAAAGGVTTLVDMPLNSVPPTTSLDGLEAKVEAARGNCTVDVALWGGCVPGNLDGGPLEALAGAGVRGFKAFLCDSGVEEFPPVTLDNMRRAAPVLRDLDLPLLVHAEDPGELQTPDGDPKVYATWLASRPPAAEVEAIRGLIELARDGVRVHVVHLACAEALDDLRRARSDGLPITVETCPHYLTFAAEELVPSVGADGDTRFKCAPPIRGRETREALWRALVDGDLDQVSSDHSPCPPELKRGDFVSAWGGIACLELLLPAVWTGARERGIGVERLVDWLAKNPARLAGLDDRKGAIRPGADADFVIWDPEHTRVVDATRLHQRYPLTPYDGMHLFGVVEHTLLRGSTVFEDGHSTGQPGGELLL